MRRLAFREVGAALVLGDGITPAPGLHPPPLIQIDRVFVGPALVVTESSTVEVPGSDHRAVLATIAPRAARP